MTIRNARGQQSTGRCWLGVERLPCVRGSLPEWQGRRGRRASQRRDDGDAGAGFLIVLDVDRGVVETFHGVDRRAAASGPDLHAVVLADVWSLRWSGGVKSALPVTEGTDDSTGSTKRMRPTVPPMVRCRHN